MALGHSPQIVTNGLVFAYDMQNTKKSFKGKPTTNLLYDTTNFSSAANEWNAQENVTVTRGQIAPDGQIQINCVKVKCNSATDSYFGVRSSALTNGNAIHSFSFWAKANKNFTMSIKFGSNQYTATVNLIQNWQYFSVSCPANLGLSVYLHFGGWGSLTDNTLEFYVYQPMYEESSFSTQFVPGGTSRSNTQALVDLTGNNTITATSLTYASDGTFSFNGTSDRLTSSTSLFNRTNGQEITVSCWIKPSRLGGQYSVFCTNRSSDAGTYNWIFYQHTNDGAISFHGSSQYKSTYIPVVNTWVNVTNTVTSAGVSTLYVNGVSTFVVNGYTYGGTPSLLGIGANPGGQESFQGSISNVNIYNRALSAAEVKQNFNALRGRFGI